jgi:hypothetical protein
MRISRKTYRHRLSQIINIWWMRNTWTVWVAWQTNDARCTRDIKSRTVMAKAAFNRKKTLFTTAFGLNVTKKLVKCYIWSIALYGAETWTFRKVDQKYLESFKMWCCRRMEKICWTDLVRNEEVHITHCRIVHSQGGEKYPTYTKKKEG